MMILVNVDFYGSDTELEVLTKAIKAFEKEEGVEFLGRARAQYKMALHFLFQS